MKKICEQVKVFDLEPFEAGDGEAFRFRLEILQERGEKIFFGKVYRLETYRLQPTFPQSQGNPPDWINDALIFVMDEMFDPDKLKGQSWNEVLEKFLITVDKLFS